MQMLSELSLGHVYVRGGDLYEPKRPKGGLLGADYTVDNGRYRFAKIYHGENWNPELRAPLTQPGVNVKAGEFLLAVNGQDVKPPDELYRFFEGTAGKRSCCSVGPNADGSDAAKSRSCRSQSELAAAQSRLGRGQSPQSHRDDQGQGRLRLSARHRGRAATPTSTATSSPRPTRTPSSSTSASTAAARRPTTSSSACSGRSPNWWTHARRRRLLHARLADLRAQGDAHQRAGRLRRRLSCRGLSAATSSGPIVGKRTWGGLVGIGGYPPLIDGGGGDRAALRVLDARRAMGSRKPRRAAGLEVEFDPQAVPPGPRPATGEGR